MANNRLVFEGLDELRAALRNLPADLTWESSHIVEGAANAAASTIKQTYPKRSGNLIKGVTVTHFEKGRFSAGAIVKNSAPHAWIFENGTQTRQTDIGANRGAMPPGHVFIPAVMARRRAMYGELMDLLRRNGLVVEGQP